MHLKKLSKRILAFLMSATMVMSGNVAAIAAEVSTDIHEQKASEQALKEAIRDSDETVARFPKGQFNFLATQHDVNEGNEYLEIAVIRQGGTQGQQKVKFRAIDVTASYGDDYEIYLSKDKKDMITKGADATPLIETVYDEETDLSEMQAEEVVDEAVEAQTIADDQAAEESAAELVDTVYTQAAPDAEASTVETVALDGTSAMSLKEAYSEARGVESDRKDWRVLADESSKSSQVREEFDAYLTLVGGSETDLTFEDGEYIKYLYLFPKDDDISEAEEQVMMALLQEDEAPVGGSYTAYVKIQDNEAPEEVTYEFSQAEVKVAPGQDKATVTLNRTSGNGYYETVWVSTAEGSANPGADYVSGAKKLDFYSGQTSQEVTVDILENEYRETDRDLYLAISKDGEECEGTCHIIIEGNGEGTYTYNAEGYQNGTEKITANGTGGTGYWQLGANDFSKNGFVNDGSWAIRANHTGTNTAAATNGLTTYGVNSVSYKLNNSGYGRDNYWWVECWDWNWKWKYRWSFKEYWWERRGGHYNDFWSGMSSGSSFKGQQNRTQTDNISTSNWSKGIAFFSNASWGNQSNAYISDIKLNLKQYSYAFNNDTKFYNKVYKFEDGKKDSLADQKKDTNITPNLVIKSVVSSVGGNTSKGYRSDKLTFGFSGGNIDRLNFGGIQASTDNKNWVKVTNDYNLVLNANFFTTMKGKNLEGKSTIYFKPILSYKNASAKFTLENENKGTFTNINKNYDTNGKVSLHIGDKLLNIIGKSGSVAAYEPTFSFKSGNSTNLNNVAYGQAGKNKNLTLVPAINPDTPSSIADLFLGTTRTEVMLAYTNPEVTVMADPNTYRNMITNEVIKIGNTSYKCENTTQVENLHKAMEALYEESKDAQITVSFDYLFNPQYMNGKLKEDEDFVKPIKAHLNIYGGGGVAEKTYEATPTTKTSGGKTTYSFSFTVDSWKEEEWTGDKTASVILEGLNETTSEEIEIDFLGSSGLFAMVYDDNGLMTDSNKKQVGSLKQNLYFKSLDPLTAYRFVVTPSNNFIGRWTDRSLDVNNDGSVANGGDVNEIEVAEKRLKELGQDENLASTTHGVYFGNSFNYAPQYFAKTKLYYDTVKKDTSTSTNNRIGITLKERYCQVLDSKTFKEKELLGADVSIMGERLTEGTPTSAGQNYYAKGAYIKGANYLVDVYYEGVHYQGRAEGTGTTKETITTSELQFPINFAAYEDGDKLDVYDGSSSTYIALPAETLGNPPDHKFTFKFRSSIGVKANKANLIFVNPGNSVVRKETISIGEDDTFTWTGNLLKLGVKAGGTLKIQGVYDDGTKIHEYPSVETGIIFKAPLTAVSILSSFKTPFSGTYKLFGKISSKFNLPLDYDLKKLGTEPVVYDENAGDPTKDKVTHEVTQIAFGYNTDVKQKLQQYQNAHAAKNKGNAMTGRGVVDKYIEAIMEDGVDSLKDKFSSDEKAEDPADKPRDKSNDDKGDNINLGKQAGNAGNAIAQDTAKKDNMDNASFDFGFSVAVILTIETGPSNDPDGKGGQNFFDSLMLVAAGDAQFEDSIVYTTPIGIDIIVELGASGRAVVAFAVGASKSKDPYGDFFNLTKNGADKSYKLSKDDFDMYVKFLLAPTVTVGAGVGVGGGKVASVTVSGTAAFNFRFTVPILGNDTASSGSGDVSLSADLKLKILFIKKSWNLYKSKRINLFSYGSQSIEDMFNDFENNYLFEEVNAADLETVSRGYLNNESSWMPYDASGLKVSAGEEVTLKEGVYPYPDAQVVALDDAADKLLAVFLGDPGADVKDQQNASTVMYVTSNDGGKTWSEPKQVDNDATYDEAPQVYKVTDDKALVVWSDADSKLEKAEAGADVIANLTKLDISGAWYNIKTGTMGAPAVVARTKYEDRTDFQDTMPLVSYDEQTGKLLLYYTVTDYEDAGFENTVSSNDIDPNNVGDSKADVTTYGDILNGYTLQCCVESVKKDDGTFGEFSDVSYTTRDAAGEIVADANGPKINTGRYLDLAVAKMLTSDGESRALDGQEINDPKIIDNASIAYNGLSLYAYTLDQDQNDATTEDRELFVQIYNFITQEFHHPIQITCDKVSDSNPEFVRCKNMTYLYWISDGDVKYINITSLVQAIGNEGSALQKTTVTKGEEKVTVYVIDTANYKDIIETAIACERSKDEDGNEISVPITEFDVRSNGNVMYLLWTRLVSEEKSTATGDGGAQDVIRENQIFGAYCEPREEMVDEYVDYEFKDNEYVTYQFVDGKGRNTYPKSFTLKQNMAVSENSTEEQPVGSKEDINYAIQEDLNGDIGLVNAGDPARKKIRTVKMTEGSGWSTPIQITRQASDAEKVAANYDDVSFWVTADNELQAIFSKGVYNTVKGVPVMDEDHRKLAVQRFKIDETLETDEDGLTYSKVSDAVTVAGEGEDAEPESDTEEGQGAAFLQSGDLVEYRVNVTNDGFKPIEGLKYKTYVTRNDQVVEGSESELQELAPEDLGVSNFTIDSTVSGNAVASTDVTGETIHKNRLIGGATKTISGRFELDEELEGTTFVIEVVDKDGKLMKNAAGEDTKWSMELATDSKITFKSADAKVTSDTTADAVLSVANSGNLDYTGDVVVKDGDKVLKTFENVTVKAGESETLETELDISGCKYGTMIKNDDGSYQDSITLTVGMKDATLPLLVTRSTSADGGKAFDAIKSVGIAAADALTEGAVSKAVGDTLKIGVEETTRLESTYDVDAAKAKTLTDEGLSAESQMMTEWSSSDPSVAYVSSDGLLIPMKDGKTEITMTTYPADLEMVGQESADYASQEDPDSGIVEAMSGSGSYVKVNSKYAVPASLIKTKTVSVWVGKYTEENPSNPTNPTNPTNPSNPTTPTNPTTPQATGAKAGDTVTQNNVTYEVKSDGGAEVKASSTTAATVTIPDTVPVNGTNVPVTSIAANAFKGNKKATTAKIGKNVTTIGANAFSGMSKLKKVTGGKNVKEIKKNAFANNPKLTSVSFTNVETIGDNAFSKDTALTKITFGAKVKKIGKNAFLGCSKMKKLTFKGKVPTFGKNAFKNINKKATFKVPKKYKTQYKKKLTAKTGFKKKTMKIK
ncbi:MAG: leucine-rich repeat protein [Lachnospiraceae bacterium]|nr:leucine-rich repeat protein [Lachnospiraceae bacterium]